jgi:single-strand DNA-binding protein
MASRSINKVILVGHLGKDAETRFTTGGQSVTNFSIATSRRWKDQATNEWKEETDWHNVVLWRAENLANYLTKGKQVYIEGRLRTRSYDDKDGNKRYVTEVMAEEVLLLGGRGEGGEGGGEFSSRATGAGGGYEQGGGAPVSMPRSARPAGGGFGGGGRSAPQSAPEPFDQGISDDDVPF